MKRERRIGAGAVLAQATHRPHRPRGPGWNEAGAAEGSRGGPCSGQPPTEPTSRPWVVSSARGGSGPGRSLLRPPTDRTDLGATVTMTNPDATPREHKAHAPRSVACWVLTVSDTKTPETDTSGALIRELLHGAGHRVIGATIVRDEPADVQRVVR